jgi:hypothetical protein
MLINYEEDLGRDGANSNLRKALIDLSAKIEAADGMGLLAPTP